MVKRVLCLVGLFSMFLTVNAFSYQFRDYTWGTPRNVVKENLLKEGRELAEEQQAIHYHEKIFDTDCEVAFLFTFSGQLLCDITLIWNNTDIGPKLKEELTKKYGESVKLNAYTEEYTWTGPSEYEYDNLSLDYNYGDTRLQYYGGDYFKQYQKELTNIFSEKNGYGPNKPPRQPHIIMELDGGRDHYYKR